METHCCGAISIEFSPIWDVQYFIGQLKVYFTIEQNWQHKTGSMRRCDINNLHRPRIWAYLRSHEIEWFWMIEKRENWVIYKFKINLTEHLSIIIMLSQPGFHLHQQLQCPLFQLGCRSFHSQHAHMFEHDGDCPGYPEHRIHPRIVFLSKRTAHRMTHCDYICRVKKAGRTTQKSV